MVLFISFAVLLLATDIVLVIQLFRGFEVDKKLQSAIGSIGRIYSERTFTREVKRYNQQCKIKLNLPEKIELLLIDKSNIRHYIPLLNFELLFLLMIIIFCLFFKPLFILLKFIPSVIVISFLFSLTPLLLLDIMARYNTEVIRRRLAEFISVLNRWCSVKEDIFYAFEKSIDSGIGEPLKSFISDMVIQVRRGIEPVEALEMLKLKVDNLQFQDFIINIKQSIRHRGDIIKLLNNLENQFYKIEEEYNRRKISTYKDRMLVYFSMFAVLFIAYFFIKSNPQIEQFYFYSIKGKALLTFFSILYAIGFYFSFGIMKFKH